MHHQSHEHGMAIPLTQEDRARRAFVSSLRSHVLQQMSAGLFQHFDSTVAEENTKRGKRLETPEDIHRSLLDAFPFKAYSSVRTSAQEMVFDVVSDAVDRNRDSLNDRPTVDSCSGTLTLDPHLELPKNVTGFDVHLAPGAYHAEYQPEDLCAGAVYDNSIDVFAFGQFGKELNDIGSTLANYIRLAYSDFNPQQILDCGCTVGHNTLPWATAFPDAEVTAIDVAAPVLRYGHARAQSLGIPVHFKQMDASDMAFDDEQFDVVFSSMFLHELPPKDLAAYLREAYRVLKPGGVLWQMELPPMNAMPVYENFYMNWDTYYNNEPYYGTFRKQNYRELLSNAGFDEDNFIEATLPRYTFVGDAAFKSALTGSNTFDSLTGRMDPKGTRWYGFGAWKE